MMNKIKTARLHLTKFLFVVPLVAVLLLAFRKTEKRNNNFLLLTGIVYDAETGKQLAGVQMNEKYSGLSTATDANGYFSLHIPITRDSLIKLNYQFTWNGANISGWRSAILNITQKKNYADLLFAGIDKDFRNGFITREHHQFSGTNSYQLRPNPDYTFVLNKFNEFQHQKQVADSILLQIKESKAPIWLVDGIPYGFMGNAGSEVFFDKEQIKASRGCMVWLDGKLLTIDEANLKVNRFELNAIGSLPAENAAKEFGINKNLILLYWKTKYILPKPVPDTIPRSSGSAKVIENAAVETARTQAQHRDTIVWSRNDHTGKSTIDVWKGVSADGTAHSQSLPDSILYFIDGRASTKKAVAGMNVNTIASMTVLRYNEAVIKYGNKAKHGAIEIVSKLKQPVF